MLSVIQMDKVLRFALAFVFLLSQISFDISLAFAGEVTSESGSDQQVESNQQHSHSIQNAINQLNTITELTSFQNNSTEQQISLSAIRILNQNLMWMTFDNSGQSQGATQFRDGENLYLSQSLKGDSAISVSLTDNVSGLQVDSEGLIVVHDDVTEEATDWMSVYQLSQTMQGDGVSFYMNIGLIGSLDQSKEQKLFGLVEARYDEYPGYKSYYNLATGNTILIYSEEDLVRSISGSGSSVSTAYQVIPASDGTNPVAGLVAGVVTHVKDQLNGIATNYGLLQDGGDELSEFFGVAQIKDTNDQGVTTTLEHDMVSGEESVTATSTQTESNGSTTTLVWREDETVTSEGDSGNSRSDSSNQTQTQESDSANETNATDETTAWDATNTANQSQQQSSITNNGAALQEAIDLDRDLGLSGYSNASSFDNYMGRGEKWFKGNSGSGHKGYFIMSDGKMYELTGSNNFNHAVFIAQLAPAYYDDPSLVYDAYDLFQEEQATASASEDMAKLAAQLDRDLGLKLKNNNDYENAIGFGGKWLSNEVDEWFVILPNGEFYQWDGNADDIATSQKLGTFSKDYFDDLSMLYDAYDALADNQSRDVLVSDREVDKIVIQLDKNLNFVHQGSDHKNWAGMQEKWFASEDGVWYYILSSGELFEWDGNNDFNTSTKIASLSKEYYDDIYLITEAGERAGAGEVVEDTVYDIPDEVIQLAKEHDENLGIDFAGSYHTNWAGQREKWLKGNDGVWYYIIPDGTLYTWGGQSDLSQSVETAVLTHDFYSNPKLLYNAVNVFAEELLNAEEMTAEEMADLALELDEDLSLSSDGNYYENWGGDGEKWIAGDGSVWYFIMPNGKLYEWDGGSDLSTSTFIARFSAEYHDLPRMLHDAAEIRAASEAQSQTMTAEQMTQKALEFDEEMGLYSTGEYHENWGGQGEKWISGSEGIWYYIKPDGNFFKWGGRSDLANSEWIAKFSEDYHANPGKLHDPLELADAPYAIDEVAALAFELDQNIGFYPASNESLNWGGWNEKWFLSRNNQWHFILPSGTIYRWGGTKNLSDSAVVDKLSPEYYEDTNKLFNPTNVIGEIAYQLDQDLGLFLDGSDHHNWGGMDEKWIKGSENKWYFVKPNGELYEWNNSSDLSTSMMVASLSEEYFEDLNMLVEAQDPSMILRRKAVELDASTGFMTNGSESLNWGGWNEKWFLDASSNWYFMTPDGAVFHWLGGEISNSSQIALFDEYFYEDLSRLYLAAETYEETGSLMADPQLQNVTNSNGVDDNSDDQDIDEDIDEVDTPMGTGLSENPEERGRHQLTGYDPDGMDISFEILDTELLQDLITDFNAQTGSFGWNGSNGPFGSISYVVHNTGNFGDDEILLAGFSMAMVDPVSGTAFEMSGDEIFTKSIHDDEDKTSFFKIPDLEKEHKTIKEIVFDEVNRKVYWVVEDNRMQYGDGIEIYQSNVDGSSRKVVLKIANIEAQGTQYNQVYRERFRLNDFVVDGSIGKMFFSGNYGHNEPNVLWSADLNGGNAQIVLDNVDIVDLAVDGDGGKIYWVENQGEAGQANLASSMGYLRRANLDGTYIEEFKGIKISNPSADALIISSDKIYVGTNSMGGFIHGNTQLWSFDKDGSNKAVLTLQSNPQHTTPVPMDLVMNGEDKLCWNMSGNSYCVGLTDYEGETSSEVSTASSSAGGQHITSMIYRPETIFFETDFGFTYSDTGVYIEKFNPDRRGGEPRGVFFEIPKSKRGKYIIKDVAVDESNSKVYWVVEEDQGDVLIYRANFDRTEVEIITKIEAYRSEESYVGANDDRFIAGFRLSDISVQGESGKVFIVGKYGNYIDDEVWSMNLDGSDFGLFGDLSKDDVDEIPDANFGILSAAEAMMCRDTTGYFGSSDCAEKGDVYELDVTNTSLSAENSASTNEITGAETYQDVVAYQLAKELGLMLMENHRNLLGMDEKWFQSEEGSLYFLSDDGNFYQWLKNTLPTKLQVSNYQNVLGSNEQWFQSEDGDWYYKYPEGNLIKWNINGTSSSSTNPSEINRVITDYSFDVQHIKISVFSEGYFSDTGKLTDPQLANVQSKAIQRTDFVTNGIVNKFTFDEFASMVGLQ